MAKLTTLQKLGIAVLVLSPIVGILGTAVSIYLSFSALEIAENSGIGAVGNQIGKALLFTVGGLIGCLVGLVLFIVGRSKK
jgi:biopolymer transport protein ExbB/TolQ